MTPLLRSEVNHPPDKDGVTIDWKAEILIDGKMIAVGVARSKAEAKHLAAVEGVLKLEEA